MSIKATCKTQIEDESDLVAALESIYGKVIQVVPEGVKARGYASDVRPTVIINKGGLIGTAGFYKNPATNKYELVYDNMDVRSLKDVIPSKDKDGKTVDRLAQNYAKIRVTKALKNLRGSRITAESLDENGNIKIKLKVG